MGDAKCRPLCLTCFRAAVLLRDKTARGFRPSGLSLGCKSVL